MNARLRLFGSIFPNKCLLCHQNLSPHKEFCRHCHKTLPFNAIACPVCAAIVSLPVRCGQCLSCKPFFDSSLSVFEFTEPVSRFIYKFKYHHQFNLGKTLSLELAAAIEAQKNELPDLIIPVPLHRKRLRQRGFNQSAMIARHVAKKLKIPFKNNYLIRHKFSVPQIELSAKQRRQAVNNAFAVKNKQRYKHIALVDDVVTTTHTVNQAAKALKKTGTQFVSVWSLARNT